MESDRGGELEEGKSALASLSKRGALTKEEGAEANFLRASAWVTQHERCSWVETSMLVVANSHMGCR